MPRDIPVGNGDMLVTFDELYRVRDIYFPCVGKYNHTSGHIQRFGVWVDGKMAWVEDEGWERRLEYIPGTLVTDVWLRNAELGLELRCNDAVDYHEPVHLRRVCVRDLKGEDRDVRLFFHTDLSIKESPVGDTANYDPSTAGVVLYKDEFYFLVNACDDQRCGIDHWSIGTKRLGGAEGTWRDAEDGRLERNAIAQGSIDATVGVDVRVSANGSSRMTIWFACGDSHERVEELNNVILKKTPDWLIARTDAYWRLWRRKNGSESLSILPPTVRDLHVQSQLILRTQVDSRGAIIAANDSDIAHYAGDHYSYCWPRDGALVAHALILSGQSELSRSFFRYCERVINKNGYFLHKFSPMGDLASSWHPWMIDGKPILPIQQDETALVLWALREHFEEFQDVEFLKPIYNTLVAQPATWMLTYRDEHGLPQQSWDLWEERRGVHLFTVAATIGALDAACKFARDFGDTERAVILEEGAERMRGAMRRHMWNEEEQRFARMVTPVKGGGYRMDMTRDSANYAIWAFAGLSPEDPMVRAEMDSLGERLWVKTDVGGCARYEHDYYHQVERDDIDRVPGNPWIICTLWQAQYRIQVAKTIEDLAPAMELLEWAASKALPSGVLAEQFDPYSGDPISVSPLTWSHATVVTTVLMYLKKHEALRANSKDEVCVGV